MNGNFADMNHNQLQTTIENAAAVISASEAGSDEYTPVQVEQARDQQRQVAVYLEEVGAAHVELKGLDTRSLQQLLSAS